MAKSLSSIYSQIERLQKEAAAIQSEVVARIQKDIAKFGLTAEQLFGGGVATKKTATKTKSAAPKSASEKKVKYADGAGNTWGGMGKRPVWIHEALAAGKVLEDLLVGGAAATSKKAVVKKAPPAAKAPVKAKPAPVRKTAAKKRAPAKSAPKGATGKAAAAPAAS